jgi:hypothetical protein
MFENVPEWLVGKIKGLKSNPGLDRESIYFNAAGWTIAWYLKKNIRDTNVHSFFELPLDKSVIETEHPLWHAHVHRALLVAETLFLMRNSEGFPEQLDRIMQEDLRSSFFEMLSAKQFLRNGYEIIARSETGRRGEDFDFAAIGNGQTINVEVTALRATSFSEKTISNRLSDKRTQVPNTAPAVLFCVIPSSWISTRNVDWDEVLRRITGQFFRRTKRWNVVVFWAEELRPLPGGGAASYFIRKPYINSTTYHQLETPFLFEGPQATDGRAAIDAGGEDLDRLHSVAYNSEFYRWVDSLVD